MRTKKILLGIIDELEKFENTLSNDDTPEIDDFILYLCSKNVDLRTSVEVQIAQQISLLHRYSKFYVKKLLKNSLLQTMDEYTYLISLLNCESLSKTELNNMNAMEKTSGNEVINRLLRKELIDQRRDEADRRSMRVFITGKGRNELISIFPNLQKSAFLLSYPLSPKQKALFAGFQKELCSFHQLIFLSGKEKSWDEIVAELDSASD
ncbi:MAG: MarR family winged helix-turn-helix transcriptional regulator [Proteiniphilum sp.]|nr:MarR family winged helix-turn-helix transcriptional regulator [Proteiniphilum sp.]MDD3909095.1 MarR family winged helix-turn-helix transcriptional regulator [Proteiniphilum sp.]MDD4416830.1 MarR family winged helix-turn-helix transcriptional regulator [Proteiniphilum sp.]